MILDQLLVAGRFKVEARDRRRIAVGHFVDSPGVEIDVLIVRPQLMAGPLVLLYEVGIIVSQMLTAPRKKSKKSAESS